MDPIAQATRPLPAGWPRRDLPPGRLADLYMVFLAWCSSHKVPSCCAETFRSVWVRDWRRVLRFRKRSTHAECDTCSTLKAIIKHARNITEQIEASGKLVAHLRDQWSDRRVYWQLRSRAKASRDVLVIICDGMDRSKYALPQWYSGRAPKDSTLDHISRPELECYACVAHGFRVDIYLADEDMIIGSSWCMDMVMRTVDEVWHQCQRSGQQFPLDLSIQADNTSREIKNSIAGRTLALLALHGVFRVCAHNHLRVGHSHEDVDQLFGLIARPVLTIATVWVCMPRLTATQ